MIRLDRSHSARRLVAAGITAVLAFGSVSPACAEVRQSDRVNGLTSSQLEVPRDAFPDVQMASGALVTEDGQILWTRRSTDRRAMASITKIMTAVVALENSEPGEKVTVPAASTRVGESTSFLRAGERLPMSELLEALLVKSGNDAAIAIARHVAGDEDGFVVMMNAKAKELGLERTHFANSHGLDEEGHYSTAEDLALLARYAMAKPEFSRIVGEKYARIGTGARAERVESTNVLLGNYLGADGVKTGWTDDAGYCVIDSATRDGIRLYAVVLGTRSELRRFKDARELLDWGFAHYRVQQLASAGTVIGEAPITDYLDVAVPASISKDATLPVLDLNGAITRRVSLTAMEAPVKAGDRVGVATFTQRGRVVASIPLVAVNDVAAPTPFQRVGIAIVRVWRRVTGAAPAQQG